MKTKRLASRGALLPILLGAVVPATFAQTYDPKTGIAELPGSPVAPTSYTQCDTVRQQWSQLSKAIEDAHQKCLDAHHKEPEDPRASFSSSNPVCSHPECQKLHTVRIEIGQKSKERVDACRADVAQFQKKQETAQQQMQALAEQQQARQEAEQQQLSAIQRELQARKAASERQREERSEEALQLEQKRREASEKIAQALAQNVNSIEQALQRKQQLEAAQNAPLPSDREFAAVLSPPADIVTETQEDLDASPLTKKGDPPDTIADSWKAGQGSWRPDGFFDRQIYVWQFYVTDADLCPSDGQTNIPRAALFQEVATAHVQIVNHLIVRSDIEKQRHFLRCVNPAQMDGYPKYRKAPLELPKTPSATIGDRG